MNSSLSVRSAAQGTARVAKLGEVLATAAGLIRRSLLVWGLSAVLIATGATRGGCEQAVVLDPFNVEEAVDSLAIPYGQLLSISQLAQRSEFTLSEYTILKHRDSRFDKPVRHFLRTADGRHRIELESDAGVFAVDERFHQYIVTSNQPAQLNNVYMLLRPTWNQQAGSIRTEHLVRLLEDYNRLIRTRIEFAKEHYGATKGDDFSDVAKVALADEIVVFLNQPDLAQAWAMRSGVRVQERAVRIAMDPKGSRTAPTEPEMEFLREHVVAVTPWRQKEELPVLLNGAALFLVGWIDYRSNALSRRRSEVITIAAVSPF